MSPDSSVVTILVGVVVCIRGRAGGLVLYFPGSPVQLRRFIDACNIGDIDDGVVKRLRLQTISKETMNRSRPTGRKC